MATLEEPIGARRRPRIRSARCLSRHARQHAGTSLPVQPLFSRSAPAVGVSERGGGTDAAWAVALTRARASAERDAMNRPIVLDGCSRGTPRERALEMDL